jgi:hypothetical protein
MRHLASAVVLLAAMGLDTAAAYGAGETVAAVASEPADSPAHAAWLRYRSTLAEQHERFLNSEFAKDPALRAQGLYFLQSQEAVAFNLYIAPRQHYPVLYTQSIFMPLELSWGMPNPDFLNHNGFIDGAHSYRVYGNMRGIRWATLQVMRGFWGDEVQGNLANIDFDDLPVKADGSFEIFLGPNPPSKPDGKYWVRLDPTIHNSMLALREVAYDWTREGPMEVHIECLDRGPGAPIYFDEQALANRIDKARKWTAANFEYAMRGAQPFQQGAHTLKGVERRDANRFYSNETGRKEGGNPLGYWLSMHYDIGPGDALIIDMPVIQARYWGFQLGSVWSQTTDYSYHHSSINNAQARIDSDGRFRAVLSLKDPGVPNWLDPAGLARGTALLRFYKSEGYVTPAVTKVRLAEVRRYLPRDTAVVSAGQRQLALDARRLASLRRYGQ